MSRPAHAQETGNVRSLDRGEAQEAPRQTCVALNQTPRAWSNHQDKQLCASKAQPYKAALKELWFGGHVWLRHVGRPVLTGKDKCRAAVGGAARANIHRGPESNEAPCLRGSCAP